MGLRPRLVDTQRAMAELLRIGEWIVNPELGRICSPDRWVALEPRLMQLLLHLAAHPDVVLPKEHLLETVWHGAFVAENTLTNAVSELRKVLGDDARAPRFIRTHAKKGYRLIAPVIRSTGPASSTPIRPRLAVTPFSPSGPADVALADLLTEWSQTHLARSRRVRIVSRLSLAAAYPSSRSLPELAADLGARYVLEGALSSSDRCLRISARLFDVRDQALWSRLMTLQGEPRCAIEMAASRLVAGIEASISG